MKALAPQVVDREAQVLAADLPLAQAFLAGAFFAAGFFAAGLASALAAGFALAAGALLAAASFSGLAGFGLAEAFSTGPFAGSEATSWSSDFAAAFALGEFDQTR